MGACCKNTAPRDRKQKKKRKPGTTTSAKMATGPEPLNGKGTLFRPEPAVQLDSANYEALNIQNLVFEITGLLQIGEPLIPLAFEIVQVFHFGFFPHQTDFLE